MKTENKNTGRKGLLLRDHRWQWMTAAAAGTAAGVTAAHANAGHSVTVLLSGNYISATAGYHLSLDLAGDGVHNNLTLSNETETSATSTISTGNTITHHGMYKIITRSAKVEIDGREAVAFWQDNEKTPDDVKVSNGFTTETTMGGNDLFDTEGPRIFHVGFTFVLDPAINDGATTPATLTFETIAKGPRDVEVELVSYTYNRVFSPFQLLEGVRTELEVLFPAMKEPAVRPEIADGLTPLEIAGIELSAEMTKCNDPRNFQAGGNLLNPARGEDVFQYCNNVVETLLPYSRGDSPLAVEVRGIIENITQADIEFAENAYNAATGLSTYQVDNVTGALDDANNAETDGLFLEAISEAQTAWRYVNIP